MTNNETRIKQRLYEIERCLREASHRAATGRGDQTYFLINEARCMLQDIAGDLKGKRDNGSQR